MREWSDYNSTDLQDKAKQAQVFEHMLRRLESEGACRYVYHRLAKALFGCDFGDGLGDDSEETA